MKLVPFAILAITVIAQTEVDPVPQDTSSAQEPVMSGNENEDRDYAGELGDELIEDAEWAYEEFLDPTQNPEDTTVRKY